MVMSVVLMVVVLAVLMMLRGIHGEWIWGGDVGRLDMLGGHMRARRRRA